jgi:hypothetical protein
MREKNEDHQTRTIETLALDGNEYKNPIHRVTLLDSAATLRFTRDKSGLTITLPPEKPNDYAYAFRIS